MWLPLSCWGVHWKWLHWPCYRLFTFPYCRCQLLSCWVSLFFLPLLLCYLLCSTLLPHHLYPLAFCTLPSFACIKRPRWRPVKLTSWHLRSHGKIGENSLAMLLPIIISTCLGNLRTVSCCLIENDQDNEIFFRWLQGLLMEVNLMSSRQCMEIV